MGTMTLQDYRDFLVGALKRGTATTNALADKWINEAIREFAYAMKFPQMHTTAAFSTVVGQYTYGFATDMALSSFRAIHEDGLRITSADNIGKLIPEDHLIWEKKVGDTTDTTTYDVPRYYHRYGSSVLLRPVPDDIYAIEIAYWQKITKLVNVGDVSQFDEDWDEIIQLGAFYRGLRYFGEDRYINARNDFLGMVRSRVMTEELEEFPEGSINPVNWRDDEDVLTQGT